MMRASFSHVTNALFASSLALVGLLGACGDDFDTACSPWCAVVEECVEVAFSECMDGCMEEASQARAISSQCANAVRDQNICLGELTCTELQAWVEEVPADAYPCKAADDGVDDACVG